MIRPEGKEACSWLSGSELRVMGPSQRIPLPPHHQTRPTPRYELLHPADGVRKDPYHCTVPKGRRPLSDSWDCPDARRAATKTQGGKGKGGNRRAFPTSTCPAPGEREHGNLTAAASYTSLARVKPWIFFFSFWFFSSLMPVRRRRARKQSSPPPSSLHSRTVHFSHIQIQ